MIFLGKEATKRSIFFRPQRYMKTPCKVAEKVGTGIVYAAIAPKKIV